MSSDEKAMIACGITFLLFMSTVPVWSFDSRVDDWYEAWGSVFKMWGIFLFLIGMVWFWLWYFGVMT